LRGDEPVSTLAARALTAFGQPGKARLADKLLESSKVVLCAIEEVESEAYACWLRHEVWHSRIDDRLRGIDNVAQLVIECLGVVGPPANVTEQEICAAIAIWCIGEWAHFDRAGDERSKSWAIVQAAISLAEAEYWRGVTDRTAQEQRELGHRTRKAAEARHRVNRERKERAFDLWRSRAWKVQADAERAIAEQCHITKEVAGRWVREFKNTSPGAVKR
jgi:hypothetical protein